MMMHRSSCPHPPPSPRGFTLIELLIVVAIVAILAAIAIPNMLEAQTRAKVSAARAQMRAIAGGVMAYTVDHTSLPPTEPLLPEDPLALLADRQLARLTTPVAYLGSGAFRDPFGMPNLYTLDSTGTIAVVFPNEVASILYYNYASTGERNASGASLGGGFGLVSIGPDIEDSLGAFGHLSPDDFAMLFPYFSPSVHPIDTIYDPTNGSASSGDVVRLGIEAGTAGP